MIPVLDHLAVVAASLAAGAAHVEAALGVRPGPGGQHPAMGTHNLLLGLGPGTYLEVIAVDPEATAPGRPRWFDLDAFSGPPRLATWVARVDDLDAALAEAPEGTGTPLALSRGVLRWRMAVRAAGRLAFDGVAPALIAWEGDAHPAAMLPDSGCRLDRLVLRHPDAAALRAGWPALGQVQRVALEAGPRVALAAEIRTPGGRRVLR